MNMEIQMNMHKQNITKPGWTEIILPLSVLEVYQGVREKWIEISKNIKWR